MSRIPPPWSDEFDPSEHKPQDYWRKLKAKHFYFAVYSEGSDLASEEDGESTVVMVPKQYFDEEGGSPFEFEIDMDHIFGEDAVDRFVVAMEGQWDFEGSEAECHKILSDLGMTFNADILEEGEAYEP